MKKIKLGIIGFGAWVRDAYIPSLLDENRAEIKAISAISDDTIKEIKLRFENKVKVYSNYEDLIKSRLNNVYSKRKRCH